MVTNSIPHCETRDSENCKQFECVHVKTIFVNYFPYMKSTLLYMLCGEFGGLSFINSIKCRMVCFGVKL